MQLKATHVNGHTVIQSLPNDSLALDVNILSLLDRECLDEFAVQIQGDISGPDAQGNLVPVAVKKVVHFFVLKDRPDRIFGHTDRIVLHCLVLSIQTNGDLWQMNQKEIELKETLNKCLHPKVQPF